MLKKWNVMLTFITVCASITACDPVNPTTPLTAPGSENIETVARRNVPSVSEAIYAEEPDFALSQRQLLVLNVNTESTFRLATATSQPEHQLCLEAALMSQVRWSSTDTACITTPANVSEDLSLQLRESASSRAVFISYDSAESRWQVRQDCPDCDLKNLKLDAYVFENANLARASFENADLNGANFKGTDLTNTRFTSARLRNASFVSALMTQTVLTRADVTDADFTDSRKIDVRLEGTIGND